MGAPFVRDQLRARGEGDTERGDCARGAGEEARDGDLRIAEAGAVRQRVAGAHGQESDIRCFVRAQGVGAIIGDAGVQCVDDVADAAVAREKDDCLVLSGSGGGIDGCFGEFGDSLG